MADTACLGDVGLTELGQLHCDENVCTLEVEKMELGGRKGEACGLGGRS